MVHDTIQRKAKRRLTEAELTEYVEILDREMIREGHCRRPHRAFEGYERLEMERGDSARVISLIRNYNDRVRAFNDLGTHVVRIVQTTINARAGQKPVGGTTGTLWVFMSVVVEVLERGLLRDFDILSDVRPLVDPLLDRMDALEKGPHGIEALARKINRPSRRAGCRHYAELSKWLERHGLEE